MIDVRKVGPDALRDAPPPDLYLLDGSTELSSAQRQSLLNHVRGGAGLIRWGVTTGAASVDSAGLLPIDVTRPPWRIFEGEALATLQTMPFVPAQAADIRGRALATWPTGEPALTIDRMGRGLVITLIADTTQASAALYESPAFVPLLHELVRIVRHDDAATTFATIGGPVEHAMPAPLIDRVSRVVDPTGRPVAFEQGLGNAPTVRLRAADRRGLYRILDDRGSLLGGIHLAIDPRECDPRTARPSQPDKDAAAPLAKEASTAITTTLRTNDLPLSAWCIVVALGLMLAEVVTTVVLSRSPAVGRGDEFMRDLRAADAEAEGEAA